MKHLVWEDQKGTWNVSRVDGKRDVFTLNGVTFRTARTHCIINHLNYEVIEKIRRQTQELEFEDE
jgi:hypothetical protein